MISHFILQNSSEFSLGGSKGDAVSEKSPLISLGFSFVVCSVLMSLAISAKASPCFEERVALKKPAVGPSTACFLNHLTTAFSKEKAVDLGGLL